jgi:DNA-binding MarR family transcriptional regulator
VLSVEDTAVDKVAAAVDEVAALRRRLEIWARRLKEETGEGKVLGDRAAVDRWAGAVGGWLVDATLVADVSSLEAALHAFRSAATHLQPNSPTDRLEAVLTGFAEVAQASLDRVERVELADTLDPSSWAAKMLVLAYREPHVTSADICRRLKVHEAQISRSGKALLERGLVVKTRHGRSVGWYVTPRGEFVAERLTERENG